MTIFIRLLLLTLILNVVRYTVGGAVESVTIMEPMHAPMGQFPGVFDTDFSQTDFARSFLYNFIMWFLAVLGFHLMQPALSGGWLVKSLKGFGVMGGFFISIALIYGNHYIGPAKAFYYWSAVDTAIVFTIVALANAWAYPRVMGWGKWKLRK